MRFTKMHGVGNDFIIFDPEEVADVDLRDLARKVCDRHFGVGADGILVPASSGVADLKMLYLNSDGSSSEMCGNGIRCLARYARDRGLIEGHALTGAGVKKILLLDGGSSRVDMGPPGLGPEAELRGFRFLRVSMGNPHAVALLGSEEEVGALDLKEIGPPIENAPTFPERTNVEFVHVRGEHEVRMRVWERGAGETLASGSGSCAAAVAALHRGLAMNPVRVAQDGGVVEIEWAGGEESVYMTGPADYVYEGVLPPSASR
jgi:diaminopimelate epimerase